LLKILDISGATVTIDALGCQKAIAQQIVQQNGDYVLAVKENQPALFDEVKRAMHEIADHPAPALSYDYHETTDGDHGRVEVRKVWCIDRIAESTARLDEWVGLRQFAMVERHRTVDEHTSVERAYYIASHEHVSAKWLAHAIRSHWSIENQLHWSLDMTFDEDRSRVRTGHAAANMVLLRKIALNLLTNEKTCQRGLAAKRLKAGWSQDYLLRVLQGGI
jgi:predicted transposase YbfD/YdcC